MKKHTIPATVSALLMTLLSFHVHADDTRRPQLHGGKSLDQWIAQAKQARDLEDRHYAMQVVRNFGLRSERAKTLHVFTELLSDDVPTIRSLAAAGIRKAGRPTDPKALGKLVELLSQDIPQIRLPPGAGEVGGEFSSLMRAVSALGTLGDTTHILVLQRIADNKKVDPLLHLMAKKAIQEIEARKKASEKEQAVGIQKLEFLVGTWKSVDPENSPLSPETRTITMQSDGQSLSIATESVLGQHVSYITYDAESQEYLLTHTTDDGERIVNHAKLTAANRMQSVIPESPAKLLSGGTFVVTVSDDSWTEKFQRPEKPNEKFYVRSFERQKRER